MKPLPKHQAPRKTNPTSWEPIDKWYHGIVGEEGHYYHKKIILPGVLRLLGKPESVLDVACGNGVLARHLHPSVAYTGIDISPSFISNAKKLNTNSKHRFKVGDITRPLGLDDHKFTHATLILALQNIEHPLLAFENVGVHLEKDAPFIIVMNHPCFRIPRQTSWGVDHEKKLQYRRIDSYMNSLKIPIQAHPGKGNQSPSTLSFHHPLSQYFQWLYQADFSVMWMEEWCSDKESTGKHAKMENRSRQEFPLFLTLVAKKN